MANRIGQLCFHTIWIKSIRSICYFAGAIENDDRWEGANREERVQTIRKDHVCARFFFLQVGRDESFVFIAIDGKKDDVGNALELSRDAFEMRFQLTARAAPGGPKIQDNDFAFLFRERIGRAVLRFSQGEIVGLFGIGVSFWFRSIERSNSVVVGMQEVIAEALIGTMRESPDVAEFLAYFAAIGCATRSVRERKGSGIFLDGQGQVFS